MPLVETLESYSRALYLPLRGYVRRPFQFVTESIREHVPKGLWDIRRAMEHTVLGTSKLVGPFDGFISGNALTNNGSGIGGNAGAGVAGVAGSSLGGGAGSTTANAAAAAAANAASAASGYGSTGAGNAAARMLQVQPSLIQFFTSPYCLLLCFLSIVLNRINAVVAPRNPHPLKLSVRFALKLPAFYLLMKSFLITLALLVQDRPTLPLAWMMTSVRTSYDESHALWLSFIAMGISCTVDSFIANLNSMGNSEQTINMLEWAIMYHFTPFGKDILIISFIQICQLLSLQFLSLSSRGKDYKLAVTTLWGIADLSHFACAVYYRSGTYPSIQLLTRLPEVVVILMVCVSMALHALTYLVTGGNVRRQMFEPNAMPGIDEEYSLAVFKVGRACMEATRGVGFRNEIDAVVVPLGTILDKYTRKAKASRDPTTSSQQPQGPITFTLPFLINSRRQHQQQPRPPPTGLDNEMADEVDVPGQRNRISRRLRRMLAIKAFCVSTIKLLAEMAFRAYCRVVPRRFRRPLANGMSIEDYLQLRATIESALERARLREQQIFEEKARFDREAAILDEEEEEEIYNDFLSRDFNELDDVEDDLDVDYMDEEEEEDELESMDSEDETLYPEESQDPQNGESAETSSFGIRRRSYEDGILEDGEESTDMSQMATGQVSLWRSLGSLQDFLLDTSFMSIFMSGRLQDTPLTRSQHRMALADSREFVSGITRAGEEEGGSSKKKVSASHKDDTDTKTLLAVLNRYRKSSLNRGGSSPDVSSSSSSPHDLSESPSLPPLSQMPSPDEDPTMYSRLLCVVCQSEPRGILLRPCRCLALCNDCREMLASRRFKQCPCCRSEVQGFSKVYLP